MEPKKVMDFADEFNVSKTTVFKKIKENNIKTEKIKNTSYVISEEDINRLTKLLKESQVVDATLLEEKQSQSNSKDKRSLKEIIDLDGDSYEYIESILLGYDVKQEIIANKDDEIDRLKQQLAATQQEQSKYKEFDELLAEKDIRIQSLNEDKVNLNRQIEMGIESLQNQQKLMISQNQKLLRLEEENQQLRESLMLTYKKEKDQIDFTEQKSKLQENHPTDTAQAPQSQQTKPKGFWGRLFGK